ncbi:hypothetical protein EST38_g11471 [Candolleomyces aberdarensis]|uniref:Uncharacterized protein n=1 Tax=Candolleomyces aberdarensis TaxID=2316362 RepID=A0A4Q2D692_9AGAR|nr:hypothetical protein EST38_g11471 [Candolleomyces aberdarensis]
MQKLAVRDFEAILQHSIPVFDGLLPDKRENRKLLKLLYCTAELHAFAKMCLHTEHTIEHLSEVIKEFSKLIRKFREDVCSSCNTVKTPSELSRREQNQACQKVPGVPQETHQQDVFHGRQPKLLNLETYKFHSLGDYPAYIYLFGPTDSFSTQPGELAHRLVKCLYGITNKCEVAQQIGNHVCRQERAELAQKVRSKQTQLRNIVHCKSIRASKTNNVEDNFQIYGNTIHEVGTCQINFTTYNNHQGYNTINPKTHPDVMVLSQDDQRDAQPFWYGCVLGVFHAKVATTHPDAKSKQIERMHFLFVRWSRLEPNYHSGFRHAPLPKVGFVEHFDDFENYAFRFLDPAQVLRECHLIPVFRLGKTHELLPFDCPVARQVEESKSKDWVNYYVNM